MNNPDHSPYSLETIFWVKILKFFDEDPGWKKSDPGSGMERVGSGNRDGKSRIRDPGWKKVGSGINIPDPQHLKTSNFPRRNS
jgi:hypothetical protein